MVRFVVVIVFVVVVVIILGYDVVKFGMRWPMFLVWELMEHDPPTLR
jgi:hypothetical protein